MALSKADILRAAAGGQIEIPDGAFGPFDDPENFPKDPDLVRAVEWLRSFMAPDEWKRRREAAFVRLHASAFGATPGDGRGRFFDDADSFGWYLFLAEAILDHPWNYEPMFGARVIPVFSALGRSLDRLRAVEGVDDKVRRMVGSERRQPNGALFELLVAASYCRAGAGVAFRPELRGRAKSWDLDVEVGGRRYAVECKRLETSKYGDDERTRMRTLWRPASDLFQELERSALARVDFKVPPAGVDDGHLFAKAVEWIASGRARLEWSDGVSAGSMAALDLGPLQKVLETDEVLTSGTRMQQLLTGRYQRQSSQIHALRHQAGMSPRYTKDCDLAIVLVWRSLSIASIDAKARDVFNRIVEANRQLPDDRPGIIHVGFEAVEDDAVERARFTKIMESTERFDPQGKPLNFVYCHHLVPESPPAELWAFDETMQWRWKSGPRRHPIGSPFLVLPETTGIREGMHWLQDDGSPDGRVT